MVIVNSTNDPYAFDLDQNGLPVLTEKNCRFAKALMRHDSNYRIPEDPESDAYRESYIGILEKGLPNDYDGMLRLVTSIDKYNSTHLASEGKKVGDKPMNRGREKTTQIILNIENLGQKISNGDTDIIPTIAYSTGSKDGKKNVSFATKFCTYVSRVIYKKDNYCIYDNVLAKILPYYAYIYLGDRRFYKTRKGITASTMDADIRQKVDYATYNQLIEDLIAAAKEKLGACITKEDLDTLLWYYFKGDDSRIKRAMAKLPPNT